MVPEDIPAERQSAEQEEEELNGLRERLKTFFSTIAGSKSDASSLESLDAFLDYGDIATRWNNWKKFEVRLQKLAEISGEVVKDKTDFVDKMFDELETEALFFQTRELRQYLLKLWNLIKTDLPFPEGLFEHEPKMSSTSALKMQKKLCEQFKKITDIMPACINAPDNAERKKLFREKMEQEFGVGLASLLPPSSKSIGVSTEDEDLSRPAAPLESDSNQPPPAPTPPSALEQAPALPTDSEVDPSYDYKVVPVDDLLPRPFTPSSLNQERVVKKLTGDNRPSSKCKSAKQNKDSFLLCTIVGFRGRRLVYAEPVGTCGIYENEARFIVIDCNSIDKSSEKRAFIDLPPMQDIKVFAIERIAEVENPDVMSLLLDQPIWRVKSFALVEMPKAKAVRGIGLVNEVHPNQHAVTVIGPYFREPRYVHMGSSEMPTLDTFLHGSVYPSDYKALPLHIRGTIIFEKVPRATKQFCPCSDCENSRDYYMAQARVLTEKEIEDADSRCQEMHCLSLSELTRDTRMVGGFIDVRNKEKLPDTRKSASSRKNRSNTGIHKSTLFPRVVATCPKRIKKREHITMMKCTRSLILEHTSILFVPAASAQVEEEEPPAIVKPSPIRCDLCLTDIHPTDEVYFKVCCLEDCHLFVHKKCLQVNLAGQGLRKKREYKDGMCPTEGCAAHLQAISEYSITNEESLYLKCAESVKPDMNENLPKKEKKREKKTKQNEKSFEPEGETVNNDVSVPPTVPALPAEVSPAAPTRSSVPVVSAARRVLPPPKPNRSIPLPVDIDNVVPLEKEMDPLEAKYSVSNQQHKKNKPKTQRKKKGVLDIEVGLRRDPGWTPSRPPASHNGRGSRKSSTVSANDGEGLFHERINRSAVSSYPCLLTSSNRSLVATPPRHPPLTALFDFSRPPPQLTSTNYPMVNGDRKEDGVRSPPSLFASAVSLGSPLDDITEAGIDMDEVVNSISSCLKDLVLNTPPFNMDSNLPVSQLKEALFMVIGERLNQREKAYIEKIFADISIDDYAVRSFVSKLKYFSTSRMNGHIIYRKNRAGRELEEAQALLSVYRPISPSGSDLTQNSGRAYTGSWRVARVTHRSTESRRVDLSMHECKICLDVVGDGSGEEILSCPECIEPYHKKCVRDWLSTNATCPQCRRNWPDPLRFPGLARSGNNLTHR